MKVFVRSMWGEPLMQTTNRKARILLKSKKAIIYRAYGGTDRADNLITVCTDCHTSEIV